MIDFELSTNKLTKEELDILNDICQFTKHEDCLNVKRILMQVNKALAKEDGNALIMLEETIVQGNSERKAPLRNLDQLIPAKDESWNKVSATPLMNIDDDYIFKSGINKGERFHLEPKTQLGSISFALMLQYFENNQKKFNLQSTGKNQLPTLNRTYRLVGIQFDDVTYQGGYVVTFEVKIYTANGCVFSTTSEVEMSKIVSAEREKSEELEDSIDYEIDDHDDFER